MYCRCCCCQVASVVSDSAQPHRQQPTRLCHPWDSGVARVLEWLAIAFSDTQYWVSGILQVSASPELTDTIHTMQLHSVR